MKLSLKNIVFTATLLAIAIVVDLLISVIPGLNLELPFGGKIFNLGLLPLLLIGFFLGLKYGLAASLIFAFYKFSVDYIIFLSTLKAILESYTGTPWTTWHVIGLILLDYLIPFTAFGLSGFFHKNHLKTTKNISIALLLVAVVWLLSGTYSGVLLWGNSIKMAASGGEINIATKLFSFVNSNLFLYSLFYNSIYIVSSMTLIFFILFVSKKRLVYIYENSFL